MTSENTDLFSLQRLVHFCTIRPTIRIAVNTLRIFVMYTLSQNYLNVWLTDAKIVATIRKNCKDIKLV